MKALALLLVSGVLAAGCASSDKDEGQSGDSNFKNQVKLNPPESQNQQDSKVYIDSVEVVTYNDAKALLISGNFPDGCTHLGKATHTLHNGMLEVSLSAWRDPDQMCIQALTPFSFVYDELTQSDANLEQRSSVTVNGTIYELK
jgi:hypothetical protein